MRRSRLLAINAMLATLIIIFTLIPIQIGPVSLALLMLLPVIVGSEMEGWKTALFVGFFLGIMSLISSFVYPMPTAPLFNNPMVSVFPRIFVGLSAHFVYKFAMKIFKKMKKQVVARSLSCYLGGIAAVITNTGLVFAMLWAFYGGKAVGGTVINPAFFSALLLINFLPEIIIVPLLSVPVVFAVQRSLNRPVIISREPEPETIEHTDKNDTKGQIDENKDGKKLRRKSKSKQGE